MRFGDGRDDGKAEAGLGPDARRIGSPESIEGVL
jgi:hypothetical protein